MQGKATVNGHPIHPMLIPFPIAFFVGALLCDIISHWGDPIFWPRMAVVLIGLGIIGALLAAIFGFTDYFTAPLSDAAKKTATTHMVLNLITVVIFAIAFYVRLGNTTATLGYVLEVIGVIVLAVSGYLGGQMVFQGGIGVAEPSQSPR
jgi:uncharacterized membrane protein